MLPRSLILNDDEVWSLSEMTHFKSGTLLYRATRDGCNAAAFHSKCDGKANTITFIKTDSNDVFGGFASASWNSSGYYIADSSAFVFYLRRKGSSKCEKFIIKRENLYKAMIGNRNYGPIFGGGNGDANNNGCDILIIDNSNIYHGSESNINGSYQLPIYLAGIQNNWLTLEIEVYELK